MALPDLKIYDPSQSLAKGLAVANQKLEQGMARERLDIAREGLGLEKTRLATSLASEARKNQIDAEKRQEERQKHKQDMFSDIIERHKEGLINSYDTTAPREFKQDQLFQGAEAVLTEMYNMKDAYGDRLFSDEDIYNVEQAIGSELTPEAFEEKILQSSKDNVPMSVKEWQYYDKLPQAQKDEYLRMKRAQPTVNLGGSVIQPSPTQPGQISGEFAKTLPPEEEPQHIAEKKAAEVTGKDIGETQIKLQQTIDQADESIQLVDDLLSHPGFSMAVGKSRMLQTQKIPGTDAYDWEVRRKQLLGKQFMEAYQTLKGGGQITEIEGEKATDAMSRMDAASSEPAFIKAARDFQDVIRKGRDRTLMKVGALKQKNKKEELKSKYGLE